jgi:hypothetical protein
MSANPFNWAGQSQLGKALAPHPGNKKPGQPIYLPGSGQHGGAYSRAVPSAPSVTDAQVQAMDSTFGGL